MDDNTNTNTNNGVHRDDDLERRMTLQTRVPDSDDGVHITSQSGVHTQVCGSVGLGVIGGDAKSGKSTVAAILMASALSERPVLGADVRLPRGRSGVLYLDTEHTSVFAQRNQLRTYKLAGYDGPDHPHFRHYNIRRKYPEDRLRIVAEAINRHRNAGLVVVDGAADLLRPGGGDEAEESLAAKLHRWSVASGLLLIVTMHTRPGSRTLCGVLGEVLNRKCDFRLDADRMVKGPRYVDIIASRHIAGPGFSWDFDDDGFPSKPRDRKGFVPAVRASGNPPPYTGG